MDSTQRYERWDCGSIPHSGSIHISVAQLAEYWSPKPRVVGSRPTWGAITPYLIFSYSLR